MTDQTQAGKLQEFIVGEIKAGKGKDAIKIGLQNLGVVPDEADRLIESTHAEITRVATEQAYTPAALPRAVIGAVLAALLGGAIWGAIVIFTGYEVGYVAWGIGFLAGAAVVWCAGGKRGRPLQMIAVASGVAGIALGKYLAYWHFLKEAVGEQYGADAAVNVTMLSADVMSSFAQDVPAMASGFDILWVILAVVTAWRIPEGAGVDVPAAIQA